MNFSIQSYFREKISGTDGKAITALSFIFAGTGIASGACIQNHVIGGIIVMLFSAGAIGMFASNP
jgi:hypothetical protein